MYQSFSEPMTAHSPLAREPAFELHDPFYLTAYGILGLRQSGKLPKLPLITVDDINDKSKSDAFARAVSVIQITWIIVQVIARIVRGLAVSQLEIAVVAFSVCAIIIYAICWKMPKGVLVPYTVLSYPGAIPRDIVSIKGSVFAGSGLQGLFGLQI